VKRPHRNATARPRIAMKTIQENMAAPIDTAGYMGLDSSTPQRGGVKATQGQYQSTRSASRCTMTPRSGPLPYACPILPCGPSPFRSFCSKNLRPAPCSRRGSLWPQCNSDPALGQRLEPKLRTCWNVGLAPVIAR